MYDQEKLPQSQVHEEAAQWTASDNLYDKSFKEFLSPAIAEILSRRFAIPSVKYKAVTLDVQRIVERKPDFVLKCYDAQGHPFMLHVEYQTTIDKKMVYRMLFYLGLIAEKYQLPVKQFLLYVGERRYPADDILEDTYYHFRYPVWDVGGTRYEELLRSPLPGEVLLAIHSNSGDQADEEVVQAIVRRLVELVPEREKLTRYVEHLLINSKLKKLEETVLNVTTSMNIVDEKDFLLYKKGRMEERRELAAQQVKKGALSDEAIAELYNLTVAEVEAIREALKA